MKWSLRNFSCPGAGAVPGRELRLLTLLIVTALFAPLLAPQVAAASDETGESGADGEEQIRETNVPAFTQEEPHWVDESHLYATNRAQALVQWMDDFFGAPVRDAERADSFVRTILIDDWDDRDGHDLKVRLRGQISLPKVNERVDLFFSGEEAEQGLTEEQRSQENDVGLRFNVRDGKRSRFDATLSLRSGPAFLPGVRYRFQAPLTDNSWTRLSQRLQYHTEDGLRSISNFEVNRALSDKSVVRLGGRIRYREEKEFWDWNTSLSYRQWFNDHDRFPSAIEYFATVSGRDQPEAYQTSYRLGLVYRRQFFREFLFYEIEPSYNLRRDLYEEKREGVFGVVLRLEIMLDDDLVRGRRN